MMNLDIVKSMAWQWSVKVGSTIKHGLPEARVITGNYSSDTQIHCFEQESGLHLTLSNDGKSITDYEVYDKEKFVMFTLKWL